MLIGGQNQDQYIGTFIIGVMNKKRKVIRMQIIDSIVLTLMAALSIIVVAYLLLYKPINFFVNLWRGRWRKL